jgi:AAA15 family ATPase/GTPase
MLIRFSAKNYLSLREEQELSLVASGLSDSVQGLIPVLGGKNQLLTVAALYGANASGKSNVLNVLHFIKTIVNHSQRVWGPEHAIPRSPFMLEHSEKLSSRFSIDFLVQEIRYQYGFVVNSREVLEEWLYAYPKGRQQVWFTRKEGKNKSFYINRMITGAKGSTKSITRKNSLFLSAAAQNNLEMLTPIYQWFAESISFVWADREPGQEFKRQCREDKVRSRLRQYLGWADLGILDVTVKDLDPPDDAARSALKEFVAAIHKLVPESKGQIDEEVTSLSLIHKAPGDSGVAFDSSIESRGTLALISMLLPILGALETGGVLAIDELESSLHPLLAIRIVELFTNRATNPKGAQLIFSTHDTNLLRALRRDQIWFTEKDREGATHLYPLSDFKPRRDENLERGYLQGRYGAIPFLGPNEALLGKEIGE